MEIKLDGSVFDYRTCYQEEPRLRESLHTLARDTFGLDLERWYRAGDWGDRYRPYSLLHGGRVVANLSVSPMDFHLLGNELHLVQIGTVMTHPDYRGRGLIHFLMARALADWRDKCGGFYLFANRDTLEFYPRFGFARTREFRHSMALSPGAPRRAARRLIPELREDRSLLLAHYQRGNHYALLSWEHNPGLFFFHCGGALREHLYYLPEFDLVAVAQYQGDTLYCQELLGPGGAPLAQVLSALAREETAKAVLGFTPREGGKCSVRPLTGEDVLFFQGADAQHFHRYSLRFPALSHA